MIEFPSRLPNQSAVTSANRLQLAAKRHPTHLELPPLALLGAIAPSDRSNHNLALRCSHRCDHSLRDRRSEEPARHHDRHAQSAALPPRAELLRGVMLGHGLQDKTAELSKESIVHTVVFVSICQLLKHFL